MKEENKKAIAEYIRSGEKDRSSLKVGLEIEHFLVHSDTFRSVNYYEKDGVLSVLESLTEKGYEPVKEDGRIIGLNHPLYTVTLEPAAQFEVSIVARQDIVALDHAYRTFQADVLPVFDRLNISMLCLGYHPVSKIDDIPVIPKGRYNFMKEYFSTTGTMGRNMMKGSAAVQTAIDYVSEADFKRKFRLAGILSPYLYFMYDNAPIFEGALYEENMLRCKIWNNTDDDRAGLIDGSLDGDFGYEDYAEYILNQPCIVCLDNGGYTFSRDKKVKDIYADKLLSEQEIEYLLTMFFFDARAKRFIEIRQPDSVPYPLNISLAALVKGLFYSEDNVTALLAEAQNITTDDVVKQKEMLIGASYKEILAQGVFEACAHLIQLAQNALSREEGAYLDGLAGLMAERETLAMKGRKAIRKYGIQQALQPYCAKPGEER